MFHNYTLKTLALTGAAILTGMALYALPALKSQSPVLKPTTLAEQYQANLRKAAPAPAKSLRTPAIEAETIWDEDFSAFAEGDEFNVGKHVTEGYFNGYPFIDPSYFDGEEGWWGAGVYEAGGKVALGYPKLGGALNTPSRELYGHLHITFRARVVDEKNPDFVWIMLVNCARGDIQSPLPVENDGNGGKNGSTYMMHCTHNQGWQEFAIDIDNPYQGDDAFIQFNFGIPTETAHYIIDDFKVTRDYDMAIWPTGLKVKSFSHDGFTATWTPGMENNSYLFSLMEEKTTGTEPCTFSEDFNNATDAAALPGWELTSDNDAMTADKGTDASRALLIDSTGDLFLSPSNGGRLTGFKCQLSGQTCENSVAYLMIDGYTGTTWENVGYIYGMQLAQGPVVLNTDELYDNTTYEPLNMSKYTRLRFYVKEMEEGDYFVIDDAYWTTTPEATWKVLYTDLPLSENLVALHDLDPDNAEYYFSVTGVKDGKFFSAPTPWFHAVGCSAPYMLDASDIEADTEKAIGSYSANWEKAVKADSYEVKNYKARTVKLSNEAEILLDEDFSSIITNGEVLTQDGKELSEFGVPAGWTDTMYGVFIDGALGICGTGDLYSPELNLNHNGGRYTVHLWARAYPGAKMAIQAGDEVQTIEFPSTPEAGPSSFVKTTLEFTGGKFAQQLMFYSLTSAAVMIDRIQVTQKVNEGDIIYTYADRQEIDDPEAETCRFTDLPLSNDYAYAYTVAVKGNCYGETFTSAPSRPRLVNFPAVSVDEIDSDNAQGPATYYDMLGRRISPDTKGIRIEVRGGRAHKQIAR